MHTTTNLVRVKRNLAKEFFACHEHLGDMGLGVWHWGLEFNGALASVVSYGTTCFCTNRGWLGKLAKTASCGVVQLCRGGTSPWAPKGTGSFLISQANRAIANLKGPLLIVAYATAELGEIGTIYQACNATYTGLSNPKGQANYIIGGKLMSGWSVRK